MTEVVRGGGGGAGFLPDGGYCIGTTEDTGVVTTGELTCTWVWCIVAGEERLKFNGRIADGPEEIWLYCFSPGVSSFCSGSAGASGGLLDVLADGTDTEAGDVNVSGRGRLSEDKLLGRSAVDPQVDDDNDPPRLLSLGCALLMILAHVATLMFIWLYRGKFLPVEHRKTYIDLAYFIILRIRVILNNLLLLLIKTL